MKYGVLKKLGLSVRLALQTKTDRGGFDFVSCFVQMPESTNFIRLISTQKRG